MGSLLALIVILGCATYRVCRLVSTDTISDGFRRRLLTRYPGRVVPLYDDAGQPVPGTGHLKARWIVELANCDNCLAVWFSAAFVLAAHGCGLIDSWAWTGLAWPATATIAGLIADWDASR